MGGLGSGRWRSLGRRQVVEDCFCISASDVPVFLGQMERFVLPVRQRDGKIAGHLPCHFLRLDCGNLAFTYDLRDYGAALSQSIQLATTPARHGGSRQGFLCPVTSDRDSCGMSCRKLYVPPNSDLFGCRGCHKLSYDSQQRRSERLARIDELSATVLEEAREFKSRENVGFDDWLRMQRRMSYAISDLLESFNYSESVVQ